MSITPASDIVLDVARAADPAKSNAATARLARNADVAETSSTDFAAIVDAKRPNPIEPEGLLASIPGADARTKRRPDARTEAVKGIEQLVLQKLVESMLPKETGALFGRGTAGEIWRSMLAQQLATQIGSVVDLGVGRAVPWLMRSDPAATVGDPRDGTPPSAGRSTDRLS